MIWNYLFKEIQKYADLGEGQWRWWWWLLEGLRVESIDMDRGSVPIRLRAASTEAQIKGSVRRELQEQPSNRDSLIYRL